MDLGEFILWIICWFCMGLSVEIYNSRNYWSITEINMSEVAPLILNNYLSSMRFEVNLLSLHYTDRQDFEYNDGLLYMSQMEEAWNMNTADEFNTSQINVLVKIMMDWLNKYAIGFMCIGSKPHPFGN